MIEETQYEKCQTCKASPAQPLHECPFDQELYEGLVRCNCCDHCVHECAMDI